jgi:hypothetical protein
MSSTKFGPVPSVKVGDTVKVIKGQWIDRIGKVIEITVPTMKNGNLRMVVLDLPACVKISEWDFDGRHFKQDFLVPERHAVKVMPKSVELFTK